MRRQPSDLRYLEQAENEFEVARHLDHPVIRRIHRLRRVKRWLSIRELQLFMEFCEGDTLQESRPEKVADVVNVFVPVASAMAHINARGYVHADMKPNNVIRGADGEVKIIDLGQSCPVGTIKQRIQGTPDFIAPEQVRRLPLDARTDVFNLGATLYWTLTGKPIPTALPKKSQGMLRSEAMAAPPEQLNEQVTPPLSKLVMDCIELNPARRPESMNVVLSRLELIAHTLNRNGARAQESPPWQDQ